MLAIALRILAIATFFIGLGLFTGTIGGELVALGCICCSVVGTVILAILVLGPWARGRYRRHHGPHRLVVAAGGSCARPRAVPIRSAVVGLWTRVAHPGHSFINAHIIVGIAVVGLIEMALGKMRRAANAAKQKEDDTRDAPG